MEGVGEEASEDCVAIAEDSAAHSGRVEARSSAAEAADAAKEISGPANFTRTSPVRPMRVPSSYGWAGLVFSRVG